MGQESKSVCVQRDRARVVKCEWLVDPGDGYVSCLFPVVLKLSQKLGGGQNFC